MAEINGEVRRREPWNWLGHILRKENDCFTPLGWTPKGRRAKGEEGDQKLRQRKSETSWVQELGISQSGCTRQKFLVGQHGGLVHLLAYER